MPESILVVDDEKDLVDVLDYNLRQAGFRVRKAMDGKTALDALRRERPGLVLLDLMLPELSGIEVLKFLRGDASTRGVPVILLTARTDEVDRLIGFELGADDYVTKPFSMRELILRVKAVLKRQASAAGRDETEEPETIRVGPIEVELAEHRVKVGGRPVDLTITEFRLLCDLVRARGRVRTRDTLLTEVWGYDSEVMSRTVDTHVRRLREKLGDASSWLETVRGVGYRIQHPAGEE